MATTNRIASTLLTVGGESASAALTFASERLVLDFTAVEVEAPSVVRMIVRDAQGRVVLTDRLEGSDTQRSSLESGEVQAAGGLTVIVECLLGSARVQVDEITGTAAFGTGSGGTQVQTADIANDAVTVDKIGPGAVDVTALGAACLAASAAGRAKMADDYFTTAEFVAGAGGKFAAGCLDGVACANVFAAGAIPLAAIASGPASLETVIADPGAGANFVVTASGMAAINIAAPADNRGLPIPTIAGQMMLIVHTAGANAGTVTSAQALDPQGTTVLNFAAELGQWILLLGRNNGAALRWQVVAQGPGVTSSTPVYEPIAFADAGNAGAIPVTNSGRTVITFGGAGHTRTLAAPSFFGQILEIESVAASASGVVTIATGFNRAGATALNFAGGVNEKVVLRAERVAADLRWRVLQDPDGVARRVADPGNGNAIAVTYDNGIVELNIAGGGHDRTLADASYAGQKLTIIHTAGGNAGTVTAASDITKTAGQNVINFTAAVGTELVELVAGGTLKWRVSSNPDALTIN